jgi:hypothetical protein
MREPLFGLLVLGGMTTLGYVASRAIYGRASSVQVEEARVLAQAVAAQVRESIAAGKPKLEQPATRRLGG